jgi:hypothetical protein
MIIDQWLVERSKLNGFGVYLRTEQWVSEIGGIRLGSDSSWSECQWRALANSDEYNIYPLILTPRWPRKFLKNQKYLAKYLSKLFRFTGFPFKKRHFQRAFDDNLSVIFLKQIFRAAEKAPHTQLPPTQWCAGGGIALFSPKPWVYFWLCSILAAGIRINFLSVMGSDGSVIGNGHSREKKN